MSVVDGFETVVGLEVHVQLLTAQKLFSPARVRINQPANSDLDAVDVGLPGALPTLNQDAVRCAIRLGIALNATIDQRSQFARKHYFYPDSPKGYQTSQADFPVVKDGTISVVVDDKSGEAIDIAIVRAHLEEDAGKSLHGENDTRLDYNRAGTALIEVVTAPVMRSGDEAMRMFRALRSVVMAAGICDGNLQEGSMRADANVSVRRPGEALGTRVELKNINSPRFLHDAVEHEAARQRALIKRGELVVQETRLWDADAGNSRSMRTKEDSPDYRYLPDPDLPPVVITDDDIEQQRRTLPELPEPRRRRLIDTLGLPPPQAQQLAENIAAARLFDDVTSKGAPAKALANWLLNDIAGAVDSDDALLRVSATALARLVVLVEQGDVAGKDAKSLVADIVAGATDIDALVDARGVRLAKGKDVEDKVRAIVKDVFENNPEQVAQVRSGKDKVKGFLVGQVLKNAGKGTDPKLAQRLVDEALVD